MRWMLVFVLVLGCSGIGPSPSVSMTPGIVPPTQEIPISQTVIVQPTPFIQPSVANPIATVRPTETVAISPTPSQKSYVWKRFIDPGRYSLDCTKYCDAGIGCKALAEEFQYEEITEGSLYCRKFLNGDRESGFPIISCSGGTYFEDWYDRLYCCCGGVPLPTCSKLGGRACPYLKTCDGESKKASDTEVCCLGSCEAVSDCTDSDGKDFFVKGYVKDEYGTVYWDSCGFDKSLMEYYCDGDFRIEDHVCEYRCVDGACLSPPETCIDGDGYCTQGCTRIEDDDCGCVEDMDCISGDKLKASVCEVYGEAFDNACVDHAIPELYEFVGDLEAFCEAYVDGCREAQVSARKGDRMMDISITGIKSSRGMCEIKVSDDDSYMKSFSLWRLGDSVEACMHNAYAFFYDSVAKDCGVAPCQPGT